MKTKKEILNKVWEDLDKTRMTSQISNDLISDVVDSVLKAINYTRCCKSDSELLRDEYWQPNLNKYSNIKIERTKGRGDI